VAGLAATRGIDAFHQIAGSERGAWEAAATRTTAACLKKLDDRGLPGTETYGKVKAYVAECQSELKG